MNTDFLSGKYSYKQMFERPYTLYTPPGFASYRMFGGFSIGWGFNNKTLFVASQQKGVSLSVALKIDGKEIEPDEMVYHAYAIGLNASAGNIRITGYKYIASNDIAGVLLKIWNNGGQDAEVTVAAQTPELGFAGKNEINDEMFGFDFTLRGKYERSTADSVTTGATHGNAMTVDTHPPRTLSADIALRAGEYALFKIGLALDKEILANVDKLNAFLDDADNIGTQAEETDRWYRENIPYFDCPDEKVAEIYYFRWLVYKNQIRMTSEDFFVVTEFIRNVPWAGRYNTICCPACHHIYEGRWLKKERYLQDYMRFWMEKEGEGKRSYSTCYAHALLSWLKVTGNFDFVLPYAEKLSALFRYVEKTPLRLRDANMEYKPYLAPGGLYWQVDSHDGMEYSASGLPWNYAKPRFDYRPTINSYMYGEACAIAEMAALKGNTQLEREYSEEAERIKKLILQSLWDEKDAFFKTVRSSDNRFTDECELIGYIPWYFGIPDASYAVAWKKLTDPAYFAAPYGPATMERKSPLFCKDMDGNEFKDHGSWNGPSWPFATAQTLTALANLLNTAGQEVIGRREYFEQLLTYTKSQYKDGHPWLGESLDSVNGRWINEREEGLNYNHSTYCDLIISGLIGLRPRDDGILEINPLLPEETWKYFCLENVSYHGYDITILYDADGSRYGQKRGLTLYVNGVEVSHCPRIHKMEYQLY